GSRTSPTSRPGRACGSGCSGLTTSAFGGIALCWKVCRDIRIWNSQPLTSCRDFERGAFRLRGTAMHVYCPRCAATLEKPTQTPSVCPLCTFPLHAAAGVATTLATPAAAVPGGAARGGTDTVDDPARTHPVGPPAPSNGRRDWPLVSGYEILDVLGKGGMGV